MGGKQGNRKIDDKIKAKVIELFNQNYLNFGPILTSERLYELDRIKVAHDILSRWLLKERKYNWQRKCKKHRQWRKRKEYFGEMIQVDGFHHDWLEEEKN